GCISTGVTYRRIPRTPHVTRSMPDDRNRLSVLNGINSPLIHPSPMHPVTSRRKTSTTWQNRLIGLETEYGCLVDEGLRTHEVIADLRSWIFSQNRFGLLDQHHRDWDEPPGNGGF